MVEIEKNVQQLQMQISELARTHGRDPAAVQLVAISKTHSAQAIERAHAAGARRFGESYLQEALEKIQQLKALDIEWHFIGRIQGNKTRSIAEGFDWVHGLCSLSHAQRLSDQRPDEHGPLNVCIQVNLSGEASKGGITADALPQLAHTVASLPRLRLRGLMTLPKPADELEEQRKPFRQLARLQQSLIAEGLELDSLSMGMSHDLEAAIAEGATLVRVGTTIFGTRQ